LGSKAAKTKVGERAVSIQRLLRVLGFSGAKTEDGHASWNADATKRIARFPAHELGLVEKDGTIRILRGDTEVTTTSLASAKLDAAVLVEEGRAIVVWSHRAGAEGCEGTDPTAVQVIPVTL
ncbi:MAG: hypothetical protein ABI678_15735, partial [Kofleriaceae bacterium]